MNDSRPRNSILLITLLAALILMVIVPVAANAGDNLDAAVRFLADAEHFCKDGQTETCSKALDAADTTLEHEQTRCDAVGDGLAEHCLFTRFLVGEAEAIRGQYFTNRQVASTFDAQEEN